jgi:tRNA-2-methylthio-N6-dimethylallyladenosine synthase
MNVYDSERITEALGADGYRPTETIDDADVVVLNTCHIREKAAEKVYSDLGRIRVIKETRRVAGKDTLITVAGCVAQAEGQEIVRREPAVDLVIGSRHANRPCGRAAPSSRPSSPRRTSSPTCRSGHRQS